MLEGLELMVSVWPEPPNVKSAGARYGVQGTFAVDGIDTPEPGLRCWRPVILKLTGRFFLASLLSRSVGLEGPH